MTRKYTLVEIGDNVAKYGYKIISESYDGATKPITLLCPIGHNWTTKWAHFQQGNRCAFCAGCAKKTIDEIRKFVENKGGKLLSEVYINNSTKLEVKCNNDHVWEIRWNDLKSNKWCPYCAGCAKKTIEEIRVFIENKGGRLLSNTYVNSSVNLEVKCENNHIWNPCWGSLQQNRWCPYCAGCAKKTIEEIRKFVENKGGRLLSNIYINNKTKLEVECNDNHKWNTCWDKLNQNYWCPHCYGNARGDINEVRKFVENKGGRLLSEVYINNREKLEVECNNGHIWEVCWSDLGQEKWCPICRLSKGEEAIKSFLEKHKIPYTTQYSIQNSRYRYDFYLFINNKHILIEYDGEQHFEYIDHFHKTEEKFRARQRDDYKKSLLALTHNHRLIRIAYTSFDNIDSILTYALNEIIYNDLSYYESDPNLYKECYNI